MNVSYTQEATHSVLHENKDSHLFMVVSDIQLAQTTDVPRPDNSQKDQWARTKLISYIYSELYKLRNTFTFGVKLGLQRNFLSFFFF